MRVPLPAEEWRVDKESISQCISGLYSDYISLEGGGIDKLWIIAEKLGIPAIRDAISVRKLQLDPSITSHFTPKVRKMETGTNYYVFHSHF